MLSSVIWLFLAVLVTKLDPIFVRFKLPVSAVTIMLGTVLGPLWLGIIELSNFELNTTEAALVFVLFAAGFEIQWSHFLKAIKPGLLVGLAGIVISFSLGFAVVYAIEVRLDEALYIGAALAATSIGLSIPLLKQQGLLARKIGQILLAAAVVDDVLALYLLSAIHVGLTFTSGIATVIQALLQGLLSLVALFLCIYWAGRVFSRSDIYRHILVRRLIFSSIAILAAVITHAFGLSAAVGGFVAGAALSVYKSSHPIKDVQFFNRLSLYCAPLFFLSVGLQITKIDVGNVHLMLLITLVLLAAIVGKLFCPWVIAKQLKRKERWILGLSLLPRGEVGLIVASIGLQQNHLSQHGMVSLVAMTLVTALIASVFIPVLNQHRGKCLSK